MTARYTYAEFQAAGLKPQECDGERCEDCDVAYGQDGLVWRATDDLWELIGWGDRGLLCPNCFVKRLQTNSARAYFAAVDYATFVQLMSPERPHLPTSREWLEEDGERKGTFCGEHMPSENYWCTRSENHDGWHTAGVKVLNILNYVIGRWYDGGPFEETK